MPNKNNPRLLLAKLRKANFTHAGDEEAIDIFLHKLATLTDAKSNNNKNALDVGCGLGGTAEYIKNKIAMNIYGIDIDANAIKHAKLHYSEIHLSECDVMQVDKIFAKNYFDLIYLFNVFYAFPEQRKSLEKLAAVAKPGAILAIFDYTQAHPNPIGLKDLADKPMNPIYLDNIKRWLLETGWELIEIIDLSKKYAEWYELLLKNLQAQKNELLKEFSNEAYDKVFSTFSFFATKIKNKEMGGSIIYAKNRNTLKSRL